MRRVVVTGIGAVTPFGVGIEALENGLRTGALRLGPSQNVDTSDLRSSCVGEIANADVRWQQFDEDSDRCTGLAVIAAREALDQGCEKGPLRESMHLALGVGGGEIRAIEQYFQSKQASESPLRTMPFSRHVTANLARELHVKARQWTFVSACAAGSQAIAASFDLIRLGNAELALAGGVEILSRSTLSGFNALHALAPNRCRPFSANREGTQLGEASAFMLLENLDGALRNKRRVLAEVVGYGMSADAFHPTRCDAGGLGPQLAMSRALADAELAPQDIDYINGHGTATFQNDAIELNAIRAVFGESASTIPISSVKSQLGHCTAASGALEAVVCVLALEKQLLPPTLGMDSPLPGFEHYDFIPHPGRHARVRNALSNSFAFGGFNLSLIMAAASTRSDPA